MKSAEEEVAELEALMRVLWDEYAELVRIFYMAEVSLDPKIRDRYKSEAQHAALFRSLFLALAKIVYDDDKQTDNPSIRRLYRQFSKEKAKPNSPLLTLLGDRFAERLSATIDQFNGHLNDIFNHWDHYSKSPEWQGLKTLRNKVIAHSNINFCDGEWRKIDSNELEFGVDDYDKIRVGVQDFLNAFNFAISAMQLNFEQIHVKAKSAAVAFWHAELKYPLPMGPGAKGDR